MHVKSDRFLEKSTHKQSIYRPLYPAATWQRALAFKGLIHRPENKTQRKRAKRNVTQIK